MTKSIFIFIWIFLGLTPFAQSQDVIVAITGDTLSGKVLEINKSEIKLKLSQQGKDSLIQLKNSDVFAIIYENGQVLHPKNFKPKDTTAKEPSIRQRITSTYLSVLPGGILIPIGIFSSTDPNQVYAGAAKPGYGCTIDFTSFPLNYIGYGSSISLGFNGIDNVDGEKTLRARHPSYQLSFSYGDYFVSNLSGGIALRFPYKRWSFEAKIYGTILVTLSPSVEITGRSSTRTTVTKQESGASFSYGFYPTLSVRYAFSEKWGIHSQTALIWATESNFKINVSSQVNNQAYRNQMYTFSTFVQAISITFGAYLNIE